MGAAQACAQCLQPSWVPDVHPVHEFRAQNGRVRRTRGALLGPLSPFSLFSFHGCPSLWPLVLHVWSVWFPVWVLAVMLKLLFSVKKQNQNYKNGQLFVLGGQFWWLLRRAPRTQHVVLLKAVAYYSGGHDTAHKGKGTLVNAGPQVPQLAHITCAGYPQQHVRTWGMLSTREASGHSWGCLPGAGPVAILGQHISKCQTPRRKAGVQHEPYCLNKQFRHSEPFLSKNGGNPPEIPTPRPQPRACLACE